MISIQQKRFLTRSAFFLLFIMAPPLNLFRFDLIENHFYFLGLPWTLGTAAFVANNFSPLEIAWNISVRFLLPVGLLIGLGIGVSWKWGRVYCGWLCPHFSMVEVVNALMRRSFGKVSIWDREALPSIQLDGVQIVPRSWWWVVTALAIGVIAFTWAVVLLTYLLPPSEVYSNLLRFDLSRNQSYFIAVASVLFVIDFTLARHLFCRYGCAVGVFQSLVWMANKKAMVVGFDRSRAKACGSCDSSCEHACPMRLKPRDIKRRMFTCTQCMQCVDACGKVQSNRGSYSLLKMVGQACALDKSSRDFGKKPSLPNDCFKRESQP